VNAVMNFRVLQNAGNCSSGCIAGGLWSSARLHRAREAYANAMPSVYCNQQLMNG
jgi:hypothetical protein